MEKSSDQPSFIRSLIKSKTENQQLDFWRSVSIAYICSKTSFPENDMIKFRNFHNKGDTWYLVFSVDGRSKLYNDIQKSNHVELCWFFALSREKYRIKSTLKGYSADSFTTEPSADSALTFEQFKNLWENEINKEEKKLFTEAAPSTKTSDKSNKQIDDINNYNTPDIGGISTNFALLLAEVSEVEHTKFAMPQVVADSRHPKFESLFSPYKVTTKYLHRKKADNANEWETVSLNP